MQRLEVYKFGGAAIKDAAGIQNVASIVAGRGGKQLLVVASAMGKITNQLELVNTAYLSGSTATAEALFNDIKKWHFDIVAQLFDAKDPIFNDLANAFVEVEWILEEPVADPADYVYDQIVSIGEVASTKILAAYLKKTGLPAEWADARNYIKTDNNYREANVDWNKTLAEIEKDLKPKLASQIIVTQGFIASSSENFTTTLGREGSDYSAAIFCSGLEADALTIWKDVPGVLNADPRWFDETEKIAEMSYQDAIELSYYGATVIHPKTIKPLQNKGIPMFVKSFAAPAEPGTKILGDSNHLPVSSFIFKVNQVLISIFPKDFSFIIEENLSNIFSIFHKHKVKVNTMLNSALSFSVSVDDDEVKVAKLLDELSLSFRVKYNKGLELVTIRYYDQRTIDRISINKKILLEVKSRYTCQMVMKDLDNGE